MQKFNGFNAPWKFSKKKVEWYEVFTISDSSGETILDDKPYYETVNFFEEEFRLIAAAPELLEDLRLAAVTLRHYETLHRAKGTTDSNEKAEVNAALASRFESTIAKATGEKA